jgi:hypothetical protein
MDHISIPVKVSLEICQELTKNVNLIDHSKCIPIVETVYLTEVWKQIWRIWIVKVENKPVVFE